jgi:hypothetical protein
LPASAALDDDIRSANIAGLADSPGQPESLENLWAAVGAHTGFGTAGPATAEVLTSVLAAVVATILLERFPLDSSASLELRDLAARLDTSVTRAWRDQTDDRRARPAAGPALPTDVQICTLFAVDIAGFTRPRRDDDVRRYMHEQLYGILQKAFDGSDIPWAECHHEDRGDGALVVMPPGIGCQGLVDPLPERLRSLVRRHNHVSSDAAQMQLRAASHIGLVEHDGHGFVGSDVNLLFRMLEARPLKRALAASGADVALIVSDYVYQALVCRHPSLVGPETFEAVRFQLGKTRARAWSYLPLAR